MPPAARRLPPKPRLSVKFSRVGLPPTAAPATVPHCLSPGLLASMTMIEFTVDTSDPSAHQYESVLQSLADVRDQIADARERQASLRRDCLEVVQVCGDADPQEGPWGPGQAL